MASRHSVKGVARLAMEEALSYSLGLIKPPDPLTGKNDSIELNPIGVKQLEDALSDLEERIPGIGKILAAAEPWRARTRFLTKIGYHGHSNYRSMAVNMACEEMEEPTESSNPFDKIFQHYFKDLFPNTKPKIKHGCVMSKAAAEKFHEELKAKLEESRTKEEEPEIVSLESIDTPTVDDFVGALVDHSMLLCMEEELHPNEIAFRQIFAKAAVALRAILAGAETPALIREGTLRSFLTDGAKTLEKYSSVGTMNHESVHINLPRSPVMKKNKFSIAMLTQEEFGVHNTEETQSRRERLMADLGEISVRAIDKDLGFKTIIALAEDGILKNIGPINEQLERMGAPYYDVTRYEQMFDPAKFPPRLACARNDEGAMYDVVSNASYFLDAVKHSGFYDAVREGRIADIERISTQLIGHKFIVISAPLGDTTEYSDSTVDDFLDTLSSGANTDSIGWEKAFLTRQADRGESFWHIESVVRWENLGDDQFSPLIVFREANRLGTATEDALRIARAALRAYRVLDRAVYAPFEVVEAHRCANISETINILNHGMSRCVTPPSTNAEEQRQKFQTQDSGVAMEAISYSTGILPNTKHTVELAEQMRSSFFWNSKPKQQQRVRESRKSPDDRDLGLLQAEQQEFLAKAIAKFSSVEELRDLHYVGIATQYPKYSAIAKACNLPNFDPARYYAGYTKCQSAFTEFMLDWILALFDKNSQASKLVHQAFEFGKLLSVSDNMKTVIDAINGQTSLVEAPEVVAMRVIKQINETKFIGELKKSNVESAKDTVRPKNRYNIGAFEELCMAFDDYERNLNGLTIYGVYDIYQKVCWQLHAADSIAEYYNRVNRPLAVMFMELRTHLFATADLLAYVLYGSGSCRNGASNMAMARIFFIDDLLDI